MKETETTSEAVRRLMRSARTFQISVDVDSIDRGIAIAEAALAAGVNLIEMGTPLLKCGGVYNVVPAFRERFPDTLLLADMKTMDGGAFEARAVYMGGGNIIDFLALSGSDTARAVCVVRDEFRDSDPAIPRLAFADILVPQQGPAETAVNAARRMVDSGVDGVGVHLQLDARRANGDLLKSDYLFDVACAIHDAVGDAVSVQVVGGLSIDQAIALAHAGLKAFVVSGNLGIADTGVRYGLPPAEIEAHIAEFIQQVSRA